MLCYIERETHTNAVWDYDSDAERNRRYHVWTEMMVDLTFEGRDMNEKHATFMRAK